MAHRVTKTATSHVAMGLAVARLAVLVTDDTVTAPLRAKITNEWARKLVSCPVWCVPIWASIGLHILPRRTREFAVNILVASAVAAPVASTFARWHNPPHIAYPVRSNIDTIARAASMAAEAYMIQATSQDEE